MLGDWVFVWTKLSVVVTLPGSATPIKPAGQTLSILKKQDGKWASGARCEQAHAGAERVRLATLQALTEPSLNLATLYLSFASLG